MLKKQRTAFRSHPSPKCVGLTRLPAYQPWDVSSVICNLKRRRSRPNSPFRAPKIAQPTPQPTYAHVSTRRERVTRDAAHSVHRFPRVNSGTSSRAVNGRRCWNGARAPPVLTVPMGLALHTCTLSQSATRSDRRRSMHCATFSREPMRERNVPGQRSSATPTDRAHENVRRRLVKQMCRALANVAWLPTSFSADVRMSEEQILDAPARLSLPPRGGSSADSRSRVLRAHLRGRAPRYAPISSRSPRANPTLQERNERRCERHVSQ